MIGWGWFGGGQMAKQTFLCSFHKVAVCKFWQSWYRIKCLTGVNLHVKISPIYSKVTVFLAAWHPVVIINGIFPEGGYRPRRHDLFSSSIFLLFPEEVTQFVGKCCRTLSEVFQAFYGGKYDSGAQAPSWRECLALIMVFLLGIKGQSISYGKFGIKIIMKP